MLYYRKLNVTTHNETNESINMLTDCITLSSIFYINLIPQNINSSNITKIRKNSKVLLTVLPEYKYLTLLFHSH